jgi:hypothetical protein
VARFRKDIPQDLKFIWTILTSSTKSGCEGSEADVGVASAAASRDRLGECRSRSFKAGDRQVEFAIELRQVLKLDRQQVSIPAGILSQLVVGHDVGAFLRLRHGRQAKRGTRSMPSRRAASMRQCRDDAAIAVDQDRFDETKRADTVRDLANLFG